MRQRGGLESKERKENNIPWTVSTHQALRISLSFCELRTNKTGVISSIDNEETELERLKTCR